MRRHLNGSKTPMITDAEKRCFAVSRLRTVSRSRREPTLDYHTCTYFQEKRSVFEVMPANRPARSVPCPVEPRGRLSGARFVMCGYAPVAGRRSARARSIDRRYIRSLRSTGSSFYSTAPPSSETSSQQLSLHHTRQPHHPPRLPRLLPPLRCSSVLAIAAWHGLFP